MAVGDSTNAVLHLLAIAQAMKVPLTIDDFEDADVRLLQLNVLDEEIAYQRKALQAPARRIGYARLVSSASLAAVRIQVMSHA